MRTAIIPPLAGVFSCFGLLASDVEYHFSRTTRGLVRNLEPAAVEAVFAALEDQARERLAADVTALRAVLDEAGRSTALPERPPARAAAEDLVVEIRLRGR